MDPLRRHLLFSLPALLAACGPGGPPPPPAEGSRREKHFIRKPMLDLDVERRIVVDGRTGHKNLKLLVSLVSKETLMELHDLRARVVMVGMHEADRKKPELADKWRMILHDTLVFSLMPGRTWSYESPIIESGEDDPWHVNHNVTYRGWVVRVENKYGETCVESASEGEFLRRLDAWKGVAAGADFTP